MRRTHQAWRAEEAARAMGLTFDLDADDQDADVQAAWSGAEKEQQNQNNAQEEHMGHKKHKWHSMAHHTCLRQGA